MKALGLLVSDEIFENCIWKTFLWPRDILMQPIKTIWTILVGDLPFEFGQIPISVQEKWFEVFLIIFYNSV